MIPIGPPKGGAFLYNPALAKSYQCGPPLIPGQNTLGSYTPTGYCDVCLGPENVCPKPGLGFLNALPGHGTSLCVLDTSSSRGEQQAPSGAQVQCKGGELPYRTDGAPVGKVLKQDLANSLGKYCSTAGDRLADH